MRRLCAVVWTVLCVVLVAACDEPDEVFRPNPRDFDPTRVNGYAPVSAFYTGEHPFVPTEVERPSGPSVEVCTDAEVSAAWANMVTQPIIPLVGAAGLDMTGGEDWAGLTIDEAQSPDALCQALYFDATGVAAWGDYFEVIAFFDQTTRAIFDILVTPGYLGVIEAGDYVFEINEPITRRGTALSRNDGSDRDPKTDANMRDIDRALIRAFRPSVDADEVDCIAAGSCYIIDSGTTPTLVFTSVDIYVPLEPSEHRIIQIETALKRPFRIGTGRIEAEGITPTFYGTEAGGIPNCEVTYGTDWADIEENCLGDDTLAMAEITPAFGYENILVQMGGVLFYLDRPSLGDDEILPYEPVPEAGDVVSIMSVNAGYEGEFSMPYSDILSIFRDNLDAAIRAEVPALAEEDPTGAELLRLPKDPDLPDDVDERFPDRLRPGGVYAAFCEPDGEDDGTEYDNCFADGSGNYLLPLTATMRQRVAATLGPLLTPNLANSAFYVQQFQSALGEWMNGAPLLADQINYSADSGVPDRIYATISIPRGDTDYTYNVYYGGNDDRLHFMNFQRGGTRMERVLLEDAERPTPSDPAPSGVFTLTHLLGSPRLGLGASGTISIEEVFPETRRALLSVVLGAQDTATVVAPYQEASTVSGYWLPQEGPHSTFHQAHWFSLYGNSIDADFYLQPSEAGDGSLEVTAISGNTFFGDAPFCGFSVRIGDFASDLLGAIQDAGYPCQLIVRRSENREFITSLSDMDSQVQLFVSNNQVNQVFVWAR